MYILTRQLRSQVWVVAFVVLNAAHSVGKTLAEFAVGQKNQECHCITHANVQELYDMYIRNGGYFI